jgi:hypothetical protein
MRKIDMAGGDLLATNKRGRQPPDRAARSAQGVGRTGRWKKLHNEEAKNLSTGNDEVQRKKIMGREETLISDSVYHVMNVTCIHLRAKGSHIYMYRRGRIYKEPLEKYNNRKVNTYLIICIYNC